MFACGNKQKGDTIFFYYVRKNKHTYTFEIQLFSTIYRSEIELNIKDDIA